MTFNLTRALLALLLALPPLATAATPPPLEAFANPPETSSPQLSPNGRYVAARHYVGGRYLLLIYDLDQIGKAKPVVASPQDMDVNWLRWKSDDRLLVSLRFAARRWGIGTIETRLYALGPDGKHMKQLVQPRKDDRLPVQIADDVVDFLPGDPEHILMQFNPQDPSLPRIYKVNVYNDQRSMVTAGRSGVDDWTVDQQGRPRIGIAYDNDEMMRRVFHRTPDGKEWSLLMEGAIDEVPEFHPIRFDDEDPDVLTVYSNHESDTAGVYRYRLSTRQFLDTLFSHPDVDSDCAVMDPRGRELLGISYVTAESQVKWLDRRYADIIDAVRPRVGVRSLGVVSSAWDYSRVLLYGESPDVSGRYYLYEPQTKSLRIFAHARPALMNADLSPMRSTSFRARDGLLIPAFVTLPPGMTEVKGQPLPAVVVPHGGPTARDMAEFDPWVQLLASRGYAVLQLNYRGSSGYGAEFMQAGFRQWGQAMQDDVTDGTRWLVEQGIADPKRICIFGGSYGGYAALMGVVKEPALYRCAVSLNGVSDLRAFLASKRYYGNWQIGTRHIGSYWKDREALEANSPVNRAADIRVPVLLAHGKIDRVVPPVQSASMAGALAAAKKAHRYLELEDTDHWMSNGATSVQFFRELEGFLAQHLAAN